MKRARNCEVYVDGASRGNPGPSGAGVVFLDGNAKPIRQLSRFLGETTNNVAEYLALIYALQDAIHHGCTAVTVRTDSELLVRQLSGEYRVRDPQLRLFHDLARHLIEGLVQCSVTHVPRGQNILADRLAGRAADSRSSTLFCDKSIGEPA